MDKKIEFAIGFVAGRTNVCRVINAYYKDILNQAKRFEQKVNVTIYILVDLSYLGTNLDSFFNLSEDVLNSDINIVYITPNDLEKEKELLEKNSNINKESIDMILGYGHARCRNSLLYYALKDKKDNLLFWDDDEYPVANILKENGQIEWIKQDNILVHLKNIQDVDITIGYHCGYISPIPYIDYMAEIKEKDFKDYVEAVSNEVVNWSYVKEKFECTNGVTYANEKFVYGQGAYEMEKVNGYNWVVGSTLCINLNKIDIIPAFFNPNGARGEDAFFSIMLKNAKIKKVPLYHFHDGFLKYTQIMEENFPKSLRKIKGSEINCGRRFLKASIGWIKYKPLYEYIVNKDSYKEVLQDVEQKLTGSISAMNKVFKEIDFISVKEAFDESNKNILLDYQELLKVNDIWIEIKKCIGD